MDWRQTPALGLLGGVFAVQFSLLRFCASPSPLGGDLDGGISPGVCAIGSKQSCNTYGSQTCETLSQGSLTITLGDWGACSCAAAPTCKPGSTEACGNCGSHTCDPCGQWASSCSGQGVCTPGEKMSDGCYEGQDAVCNAACELVCP